MSNKESEQPVGDAQRKEEEQTVEDSPEGSVPEFRGDVTAKIKAGKYPRGYPDGRTVSVVSKQKGKTQRISVTISRGRPNRHGWEYQLVTAQGEPYQNGKWVDEDDISNQMVVQQFEMSDREGHPSNSPRWGSDGTLQGEEDTPPPAYSSTDNEAESQTKATRRRSLLQRLFRSNSSGDSEEREKVDIADTIVRSLEECQEGYPRLAAFKACEQSFSMYRGFSYVHARLILNLQAKIAAFEKELDRIDEDEFEDEDTRLRLSNVREDIEADNNAVEGERTRQQILEELRVSVLQYDELLIKAKQLASFQRPTDRDYRSVRTFFWNFRPLAKKDEQYIRCREDIISLRNGREWAGFDQWVETTLLKLSRRFPAVKRTFCDPDLRRKTEDDDIRYLSPARVETFVGLMITAVVFILLVLPVVGMYRLSSFGDTKDIFAAIGVMIVATLLFAAAMSLLTKARRHELFAASAAYCAILVVFITNV